MSVPVWRLSASLIIARPKHAGSKCDYQLCFVRRSSKSRFMPNTCVFPGGRVDDEDHEQVREMNTNSAPSDYACRLAAVREVFEETGLHLGLGNAYSVSERKRIKFTPTQVCLDSLIPFCEWITPADEALRHAPKGGFRTKFFVAILSTSELTGSSDETETSDLFWMAPDEAVSGPLSDCFAFPQKYILNELAACKRLCDLGPFVTKLKCGLFRYPYQPVRVTYVDDVVCYAMPGDKAHDEYKPMNGADWVHRGFYTWTNGIGVQFDRSSGLIEAVGLGGDWAEKAARRPGCRL